ncbi:hypothetical protein PHYPSEUDO_011639 [Phytophthora pseudosyringae]|uniref:Uncharacterized protein n=1 Tax=Phytophthora pseudosyringae TaxID=221518 RepID=A0A8T1V907_9STRA|nr:hypothetical protein PHYPSEUDO_011639 [Phytophthora pseudosyringae]
MTRRERVAGVENYSPEDVKALLEFTGNVLPTGANEWESSYAPQPAKLGVAAVQAAGALVPAARVARRSLSALCRRPVARVRVRLVPRKIVLTALPFAFLFLAFGGEGKREDKHRILVAGLVADPQYTRNRVVVEAAGGHALP